MNLNVAVPVNRLKFQSEYGAIAVAALTSTDTGPCHALHEPYPTAILPDSYPSGSALFISYSG